eukprot:TRINITY_DN778058_c0_g1_i1.p1 TRINITY_DN778058_c0_g1~~TRINITY_DN778058_c0_g1_i1.p1  ORF type:complete len:217 (-),score=39.14 TRINITY_DN778058_c0_g1_i1:141-791(-)
MDRLIPGMTHSEIMEFYSKIPTDTESKTYAQRLLQSMLASECSLEELCSPPEGIQPSLWKYEHLKQFSTELSQVVHKFGTVCTKESCPTMRIDNGVKKDWMFLCAAHKKPKECCAIDYFCHTLDGTTALLASSRWFPKRQVGPKSDQYFQSIARRLARIFLHNQFHHQEMFKAIEKERMVFSRFSLFTKKFKLLDDESEKMMSMVPNAISAEASAS